VTVVCNTSPVILLAKIGRLELFSGLYDQIIIPASVLDEIEAKPSKETKRITALVKNRTFEVQRASRKILEGLPADLGAGEREAIALAVETQADLVVLDDQQGRRTARERGISVTGTVGVLIEARERGIIPSVRRELDRLIEAGMWIDEVFYHRILQEFDE
jgi:predicted nucleic acid-binding protein